MEIDFKSLVKESQIDETKFNPVMQVKQSFDSQLVETLLMARNNRGCNSDSIFVHSN